MIPSTITGSVYTPPVRDLEVQPTYRAGLYAELQKFGDSKRDGQLNLWPEDPEDIE